MCTSWSGCSTTGWRRPSPRARRTTRATPRRRTKTEVAPLRRSHPPNQRMIHPMEPETENILHVSWNFFYFKQIQSALAICGLFLSAITRLCDQDLVIFRNLSSTLQSFLVFFICEFSICKHIFWSLYLACNGGHLYWVFKLKNLNKYFLLVKRRRNVWRHWYDI